MKHLLIYSLFILLAACKREEVLIPNCAPERFLYEGTANKKIDILLPINRYQIVSGGNIVFVYTHIYQDCEGISDDEGSNNLVFEIPAASGNFSYSNAGLSALNCHSQLSCYCANTNATPVTQGSISGIKTGVNQWQINANVSVNSGGTLLNYFFNKLITVQ
jgi:hypothetical protein